MARPPGLALSKQGARTTSISGVIWVVRRACDERHITGGEACTVHDEVPKGGCARSHTVRQRTPLEIQQSGHWNSMKTKRPVPPS